MPAGEGCADKAVSTGDEHAPAGEHAASGHTAAEMHATSGHAAAAAERRGWRCHDDCRRHHGRDNVTEKRGFHDSDPP
jgi:hypothetical protein